MTDTKKIIEPGYYPQIDGFYIMKWHITCFLPSGKYGVTIQCLDEPGKITPVLFQESPTFTEALAWLKSKIGEEL